MRLILSSRSINLASSMLKSGDRFSEGLDDSKNGAIQNVANLGHKKALAEHRSFLESQNPGLTESDYLAERFDSSSLLGRERLRRTANRRDQPRHRYAWHKRAIPSVENSFLTNVQYHVTSTRRRFRRTCQEHALRDRATRGGVTHRKSASRRACEPCFSWRRTAS